MSRKDSWYYPEKKPGKNRTRTMIRLPEPFLVAITERAGEETEKAGRKVSRDTMLMTYALRADKQLRKRYNELRENDAK